MALLSRFWNPLAAGRRPHIPVVTVHQICYGYMQNDWAMVFAASKTILYSAACLIIPNGTQPGSNP
jgi:hypothetical protein